MAFWKPGTEAPGSVFDREGVSKAGSGAGAGPTPTYNPHAGASLAQQRRLLPAFKHRHELLWAIETHRTVVVVGETGCGKSTQIPQYLHEAHWTDRGRVIACVQPRRVAAMTLAARVADEMGVRLGQEVGYTVRFDDCSNPDRCKIKYMTDGILLREILQDPLLSRYSVVMLDEAHERSLEMDMLMGLLKKVQRKRPFLRLIVSSATLEAEKFKEFFETNIPAVLRAPLLPAGPTDAFKPSDSAVSILSLEGRQFPVEVMYLAQPVSDYVRATIDVCIRLHMSMGEGDILAFLPRGEDIDRAVEGIQDGLPRSAPELVTRPLYATLPWDDQLKALAPARITKGGRPVRKCVVATNIAETSVTIPGVVYVVDAGFVKMPVYNPLTGMESLVVQPISQAQANQRAGRAGRVRPGKCLRLFTEDAFKTLRSNTPPEMVRTNLAPAALHLKALGISDIAHFEFMDPPPAEALIRALELLYALGALDEKSNLVEPRGRFMAEFPAEPRLAAMLLASLQLKCSEEALTVAAMCSIQGVWVQGRDAKKRVDFGLKEFAVTEGDHLTLLNVYNGFLDNGKNPVWCAHRGLNFRALCRASEVRRQLRRHLARVASRMSSEEGAEKVSIESCDADTESIRRCIVAGFFSNAARLAPDGRYLTVRDNRRVAVDPSSVLQKFGQTPEWVVYHDVTLTTEEYIREVTEISPRWLTEMANHYYELKGSGAGGPARRQGVAPSGAPSDPSIAELGLGKGFGLDLSTRGAAEAEARARPGTMPTLHVSKSKEAKQLAKLRAAKTATGGAGAGVREADLELPAKIVFRPRSSRKKKNKTSLKSSGTGGKRSRSSRGAVSGSDGEDDDGDEDGLELRLSIGGGGGSGGGSGIGFGLSSSDRRRKKRVGL